MKGFKTGSSVISHDWSNSESLLNVNLNWFTLLKAKSSQIYHPLNETIINIILKYKA